MDLGIPHLTLKNMFGLNPMKCRFSTRKPTMNISALCCALFKEAARSYVQAHYDVGRIRSNLWKTGELARKSPEPYVKAVFSFKVETDIRSPVCKPNMTEGLRTAGSPIGRPSRRPNRRARLELRGACRGLAGARKGPRGACPFQEGHPHDPPCGNNSCAAGICRARVPDKACAMMKSQLDRIHCLHQHRKVSAHRSFPMDQSDWNRIWHFAVVQGERINITFEPPPPLNETPSGPL